MKNALLVCFAFLVIIASVYGADAGYRIVWTREVTTPEAQKALKTYVEDHCKVDVWYYELPAEDKNLRSTLRLHCTNEEK